MLSKEEIEAFAEDIEDTRSTAARPYQATSSVTRCMSMMTAMSQAQMAWANQFYRGAFFTR